MRVLHGSINIANQPATYCKGLNEIGVEAKSVNYMNWGLGMHADYEILNPQEIDAFFVRVVLTEFDTYHMHWGTSLHYSYYDLPVFKNKKLPTYMNFWGSECRMPSIAKKLNPKIRCKVQPINEDEVKKKLAFLGRYIDTAIVADFELHEYVSPFFKRTLQLPQAIDVQEMQKYRKEKPKRDSLLFVHAPTDEYVKCTKEVTEAVERLNKKGINADLHIVKGMPYEEAKKIYATADVIIDSLSEGVYGLFALECMAMGIPVVAWITEKADEFYKGSYGVSPPIIKAHYNNIYIILKEIIEGKYDLDDTAKKSFEYVSKNHDYIEVAKRLKEIYEGKDTAIQTMAA